MKSLEVSLNESLNESIDESINSKDYGKFLRDVDSYLLHLLTVQIDQVGKKTILERPNLFGIVMSEEDLKNMRKNQIHRYGMFEKILRKHLVRKESNQVNQEDIHVAFARDVNWTESSKSSDWWYFTPCIDLLGVSVSEIEDYISGKIDDLHVDVGSGEGVSGGSRSGYYRK